MSKPITPNEVGAQKVKQYPSEVFDAFNECIAAEYVGDRATVEQKVVKALLVEKLNAVNKPFKMEYLNVEAAYRAVGWSVTYDKPCYNEDYGATFLFKRKNG